MAKTSINDISGYVCVPYLHNHLSIELKDLWVKSRNIDSLFFVTATFSDDSKPYFVSPVNHFILAKYKNSLKIQKDLSNSIQDQPIFVFDLDDIIFDRGVKEKTNFISIYYLEYGDSLDDLLDVSAYTARRDKIGLAGFGNLKLFVKETPKFTFPYSDHIIIFEISSEKSHQSDNKYCEQTRRDICRKGIVMNNLVSFSVLEKLK
jgi:hypothetical protein